MEVLFLTIFLSLALSAVFFSGYIRASREERGKSLEQQSLMPLEKDQISRQP